MNLKYSFDRNIESAYIVTLKGHAASEKMSQRCQLSCKNAGMPYKVWDAYDGTSGKIVEPVHLRNEGYMSWFKNINKYLTTTQICCALSHISLWAHCVYIDKPIMILEHDAILLKPLRVHDVYNSIIYLGCIREYKAKKQNTLIPMHLASGHNYHFMAQTHAYAIDPQVAKNLLSYVLKFGIYDAADIMIRADLFNIIELDIYAYEEIDNNNITITKAK